MHHGIPFLLEENSILQIPISSNNPSTSRGTRRIRRRGGPAGEGCAGCIYRFENRGAVGRRGAVVAEERQRGADRR